MPLIPNVEALLHLTNDEKGQRILKGIRIDLSNDITFDTKAQAQLFVGLAGRMEGQLAGFSQEERYREMTLSQDEVEDLRRTLSQLYHLFDLVSNELVEPDHLDEEFRKVVRELVLLRLLS